jgi:hypothetical protein
MAADSAAGPAALQRNRERTNKQMAAQTTEVLQFNAVLSQLSETQWALENQLPFNLLILIGEMVRPERFELPTFWFVARRSIQLS